MLFDQGSSALDGVDVLANSAEGGTALASIVDADGALFDRHIAINLKSTFNGLRDAVVFA